MAKKENEIDNCFWSFSGPRNLYKLFSFKSSNSADHGFTLLEVLVVVAVIGVLAVATISLIDPIGQTKRAKDGQRKSDLKQIQAGLELYRADVGSYPADLGNTLSNGSTTYMQNVPQDSKFGSYKYAQIGGGSSYTLNACAEKVTELSSTSDPKVVNNEITSCTSSYNFQVTSP